jgi:hypothetical protein
MELTRIIQPVYSENLADFYEEGAIHERQRRKAPKGNSESPWSLHIRSFWKTHFINPPEVKDQFLGLLIYR